MASSMASEMAKAVNSLGEGFAKFSSGTITEAIWNGEAADNAKNQITSKIDPKVEEVTTKLNNLQQALDLVENSKIAKGNMESYEKAISELNPEASDYHKVKREYNSKAKEFRKEYEGYIKQIKSLCGS